MIVIILWMRWQWRWRYVWSFSMLSLPFNQLYAMWSIVCWRVVAFHAFIMYVACHIDVFDACGLYAHTHTNISTLITANAMENWAFAELRCVNQWKRETTSFTQMKRCICVEILFFSLHSCDHHYLHHHRHWIQSLSWTPTNAHIPEHERRYRYA